MKQAQRFWDQNHVARRHAAMGESYAGDLFLIEKNIIGSLAMRKAQTASLRVAN